MEHRGPTVRRKKKVLAIASVGGHWIELLRLKPLWDEFDTIYVSTNDSCAAMVPNYRFYKIKDFSRWDKAKSLVTIWQLIKIIIKEKPDVVISTGAAPGLIGLMLGKVFLRKTIWIDSIANVEEVSMSGRIASKFVSKVYVQWPDLATKKLIYKGNVL